MNELKPIGYVKSRFAESTDPFEMMKHESVLVINKDLEEGLYDIESSAFIDVVFHFDKSEGYKLRLINYFNEDKGVFASRSPKRPNQIGVTTVKLLKRNGCELTVSGFDALDNTPILDIKPTNVNFLKEHFAENNTEWAKANPRWEITRAIKTNDLHYLLLEAGKLHGHFCPGLSLGVKAATYAMRKMRELSDGMEDLVVIVETNNCASDGVQFVTGCSFGNNALIFKDFGKLAFTLATRNGKGIRMSMLNNSQEVMQGVNSEFQKQFKKVVIEKNHDPEEKAKLRLEGTKASFNLLDIEFDKLFKVEEVEVNLPKYAPIHESIICTDCGESTMATRIIEKDGKNICLSCHEKEYFQLDGHGMKYVE